MCVHPSRARTHRRASQLSLGELDSFTYQVGVSYASSSQSKSKTPFITVSFGVREKGKVDAAGKPVVTVHNVGMSLKDFKDFAASVRSAVSAMDSL